MTVHPKRSILAAVLATSLVFPVLAQAQEEGVPVGKLTLEGGSVAAGIGFTWGSGTLAYQGQTYHVRISGLAVGDVGASSIDAAGDVYNLTRLADFNGTYAAAGAGAALAGGGSIVTMQNGNGVVIQLRSQLTGVRLSLGISGITMSIVQ
jgi:hypothetical protein